MATFSGGPQFAPGVLQNSSALFIYPVNIYHVLRIDQVLFWGSGHAAEKRTDRSPARVTSYPATVSPLCLAERKITVVPYMPLSSLGESMAVPGLRTPRPRLGRVGKRGGGGPSPAAGNMRPPHLCRGERKERA